MMKFQNLQINYLRMNKKIYQNNRFIRTLLKLIRKLIERLMMHLLK